MEYKRSERVGDQIQREIADMLYRTVKDPRINAVTITGVELSQDLRHARVYFFFRGSPEERQTVEDGLRKARGFIRKELGKRLHLRYSPELAFHFDTSFEYGSKIDQLLKTLQNNENE